MRRYLITYGTVGGYGGWHKSGQDVVEASSDRAAWSIGEYRAHRCRVLDVQLLPDVYKDVDEMQDQFLYMTG